MGQHQLALELDDATKQRLEAEARWQDQSEAEVAADAIKAYLNRQAYKREALQAAADELDRGVLISGDAMHRWIDSWGTENELAPPEPDIFLPPRR